MWDFADLLFIQVKLKSDVNMPVCLATKKFQVAVGVFKVGNHSLQSFENKGTPPPLLVLIKLT